MTSELVVHGFETSNNMKVRVALGFKDIPYEFHSIDPADRGEILKLSGQHLTPVMVHDGHVLFDSAAILRYLESNFRDRPPLFGSSHKEQWAIEDEELFARTTLAQPMMEIVHTKVCGGSVDEGMQTRCADAFRQAAGRLARALEEREWLVGDQMSAADVTAAPVMYRIRRSGLFDMPPEMKTVQAWVDRVMEYDRYLE